MDVKVRGVKRILQIIAGIAVYLDVLLNGGVLYVPMTHLTANIIRGRTGI